MISFDNTEIAFKYKTDKELKQAYRLFKLVGKPWLVQVGKKMVPFAFRFHLPISGIIRSTIFKQFCGGENIDDCDATIQKLFSYNVGTILDYSVEGQEKEEDFEKTKAEIIQTILKAKDNREAIPFAVFKMTGLARKALLEKANDENTELTAEEKDELFRIIQRVDAICKTAHDNQVPLFIDAEETWIQDTMDRIVISMMAKYNKERCLVYNTVQLYRHDRIEFMKKGIQDAKEKGYHYGLKFVRGAYMERERERAQEMNYPDPIQPDKASCDRDFNLAIQLLMDNIDFCSICCGTHNEESSQFLTQLIKEKGLEKNDKRIYFAQLLGMSDHISFNLAHEGYNVTKYVPYGPIKKVMPYLLRRADENTSVAGQTGRELNLISKEWARRKNS